MKAPAQPSVLPAMSGLASTRHFGDRWQWWLAGVFVVPLCLNLLVGIPYQILVDRDLQLHGVPVVARITATRDVRTKGGWVREYEHRYRVDGVERVVWLGGSNVATVGGTESLEYSPMFPWRAHRPAPLAPWDQNLFQRLGISFTQAFIFGTAWIAGLRTAMKRGQKNGFSQTGA